MNQIIKKEKMNRWQITILTMLLFATFIITSWTCRNNFYFLFDDYTLLQRVQEIKLVDLINLWPDARYNDRPIRDIFFYIFYNLFGMDYQKWYFTILLWHIFNTFLVFYLFNFILNENNQPYSFECALIGAAFFGIYPKTVMAVFWIAGAANDLICCSMALISMIFYLLYAKLGYNNKIYFGIGIVSYFIGLRTKEAILFLPLLFVLYEVYSLIYKKQSKLLNSFCIFTNFIMCAYATQLILLPGVEGNITYQQSFFPADIIKTLLSYIKMYFALDDSNFSYNSMTDTTFVGYFGLPLICCLVIIALYQGIRKKNLTLIFLFLAIGISMAPVLTMKNVQHMLYLYFPAVFISLLWAVLSSIIILKLKELNIRRIKNRVNRYYITSLLIVLLMSLHLCPGPTTLRNLWISLGNEAYKAAEDIKRMPPISVGTNIYVENISDGQYIMTPRS